MRRGYKWVDREIERLDPETDYERILALVAEYRLNEMVLDLTVSSSTMSNVLPPHGSETLAYTDKIVNRRDKRYTDGARYFWTWFPLGPSHPDVQASVQKLNKVHMAVARKLPGNFSHNEDFVFTLCGLGVFPHRLRLLLGLDGMPEHLQIAFHHWLRDISKLMVGEHGPITGFPDDYAGMVAVVDEFEGRPWPQTETGKIVCEGIIRGFVERWFPPRLHGVGRMLLLSTVPEHVRRVHRLEDPPRRRGRALMLGLKLLMLAQERVLPDPRTPTTAKRAKNGSSARLAVSGASITAAEDRVRSARVRSGSSGSARSRPRSPSP